MATDLQLDLRPKTFGELLRHFRVRRMLSIRELARGAGICPSHVTMLEHGQRTPRFKSLRGLCHALSLEGDEFAVFCDAALRHAPAHMQPRPVEASALDGVPGNPAVDLMQRVQEVDVPQVTQEVLFRQVTKSSTSTSSLATDALSHSLAFTTPPIAPPAPATPPLKPRWRKPIRH